MKRRHITAMFGLMIMAMAVGISVCAEENTDAAAQAIADRKEEAEESGEYEKVVFAFYNWTGRPAGDPGHSWVGSRTVGDGFGGLYTERASDVVIRRTD